MSATQLSYRFVYFNIRGAGELCRLTLALSGAPWQDIRYPMALASTGFSPGKEFHRDAAAGGFDANMGSLPILQIVRHQEEKETENEDPNSKQKKPPLVPVLVGNLGQSHSIAKFVASQHGLAGRDALEYAKMDAIYEHCRDIKGAWYRARRETNGKSAWFSTADNEIENRSSDNKAQTLQSCCQRLEKAVVASASTAGNDSDNPWCLGGPDPSLADLAVYHLLATPRPSVVTGAVPSFFDGETDRVKQAFVEDCPKLTQCVKAVGSIPAIQEWERTRPETFN